MAEFRRYLVLGEEAAYGAGSAAPALYLDLAGESLKRKQAFSSIRPERRAFSTRQADRGRSVAGGVDVFLGYTALAQMLRWICSDPTSESLGGGVWMESFVPSALFSPASLEGGIPRDVEQHDYTGLFFVSARLSFGLGDQYFGLSLQCLGADEQPGGAVPDIPVTVFYEPAHMLFRDAPEPMQIEVSDGATNWAAFAESVDLNFTWNRKLRQPERRMTPTGIVGGGIAGASCRFRWLYGTDTDFLLDAYRSRADVSFRLSMQGASIGSGAFETNESLEVYLPVCRVNADPPTIRGSGAGNLDFSIDLEPLHSAADGFPYRIRVTYGDFEQELLENGGDEDGITGSNPTGWTATGVAFVQDDRVGGAPGYPGPQAGTYYFSTLSAANSAELYQDVDVSAYAARIDTGVQRFTFSGYYSSIAQPGDDDTAQIIVEYRTAGGSVLSTYDTSAVTSPSVWTQVTDTRTAPVTTRTVRVRLITAQTIGGVPDGYFDSLSLKALRP